MADETVRFGRATEREGVELAHRERAWRNNPSIYWFPTYRCNLACKHCVVSASPQVAAPQEIDRSGAMRVIRQMVDLNVKTVILSGGEPLLRRDLLAVIESLVNAGIKVDLTTNGLLVNERFVQAIRPLQQRGRVTMSVSLDGGTRESHEALRGANSYARTVRSLRLLKAAGIRFSIEAVLNRASYATLPELFARGRELAPSLRSINLIFLNPVGRGQEVFEQLGLGFADYPVVLECVAEEIEQFESAVVVQTPPATVPPRYLPLVLRHPRVTLSYGCDFPLLMVLPDGDVSLCGLWPEDDRLRLGSVATDTLEDLWSLERIIELRRRHVAAEGLSGICSDCVWKYRCRGSCRAWAFEESGSFAGAHPVCARMEREGYFPDAYRLSRYEARAERYDRLESRAGGTAV